VGAFQAILLPGLCVTSAIQTWSRSQRLIYAVPLSLLINHYLVCILVACGLYGLPVMAAVLTLEIFWLARCENPAKARYASLERPGDLLFFVLAAAAFTKYAEAWARMFGDVFQMWDARASWNHWARDWFEGRMPMSGMYPNGLPTVYSVPYAFMGRSDLEMYSKAVSGIFFLAALAALIELGWREVKLRRLAWASVFFYPGLQAGYLQSHWVSGYADVPLAAFSIFFFCMAALEKPFLLGLVAGSAALVKQPGMFFAGLSPLLANGWPGWKKARKDWPRMIAGIFLAATPYYLFVVVRIYFLQSDRNNVGYLASIVPGGLAERWTFTLQLLQGVGGAINYLAWLLIVFLGAVVSKEARRWLLLLGLPWFLIWGTFFGYDIRNISLCLFPWALAFSAGLEWIFSLFEKLVAKRPSGQWWKRLREPAGLLRVLGILTVALLLTGFTKPLRHWRESGSPAGWEREQRMLLGDLPQANLAFARLAKCDARALQVSNYGWAREIPGLEVKIVECGEVLDLARRHARAYAFVDTAFCSEDQKRMLDRWNAVYTDGRAYVLALDPQLPTSCVSK
jgi:hypothetical protein